MDPLIDLVRDRTADLQRVAQGVRRERELSHAAAIAPAGVGPDPTSTATAEEPARITTAVPTADAGHDRQAA
ncbi:hypothetical protein BH20CHL7_BH20CHL7_15130 [soil metagenome]